MSEIREDTKNMVKKFYKTKKESVNCEISIYNYTIDYCSKNNILCSWEEELFLYVYKQKRLDVLSLLKNKLKISSQEIAFYVKEEEPEDVIEVEEGIFQCSKCQSKKTTCYSLQTRSADEPMTNFITCVNCKHKWKM